MKYYSAVIFLAPTIVAAEFWVSHPDEHPWAPAYLRPLHSVEDEFACEDGACENVIWPGRCTRCLACYVSSSDEQTNPSFC